MEFDKDLRSIQEARDLAALGNKAAKELEDYTEERIEAIIKNMVRVGEEHAYELAKMAVEETGFGVVEDKVFKNHMASGMLYDYIKDMKTISIIEEDKSNRTATIDHASLSGALVAPALTAVHIEPRSLEPGERREAQRATVGLRDILPARRRKGDRRAHV